MTNIAARAAGVVTCNARAIAGHAIRAALFVLSAAGGAIARITAAQIVELTANFVAATYRCTAIVIRAYGAFWAAAGFARVEFTVAIFPIGAANFVVAAAIATGNILWR